jgi:hypothetical protein
MAASNARRGGGATGQQLCCPRQRTLDTCVPREALRNQTRATPLMPRCYLRHPATGPRASFMHLCAAALVEPCSDRKAACDLFVRLLFVVCSSLSHPPACVHGVRAACSAPRPGACWHRAYSAPGLSPAHCAACMSIMMVYAGGGSAAASQHPAHHAWRRSSRRRRIWVYVVT